jgi:hypothetical protein
MLPAESEQERAASDAIATFRASGFGYFLEQATRPQTIGYALLDSPVALAAWMLDHDTDACPAQLGGEVVPQRHLLPRGRQGRPLRRLGRAGALLRRSPRGVPDTALAGAELPDRQAPAGDLR